MAESITRPITGQELRVAMEKFQKEFYTNSSEYFYSSYLPLYKTLPYTPSFNYDAIDYDLTKASKSELDKTFLKEKNTMEYRLLNVIIWDTVDKCVLSDEKIVYNGRGDFDRGRYAAQFIAGESKEAITEFFDKLESSKICISVKLLASEYIPDNDSSCGHNCDCDCDAKKDNTILR